MPNLSVGSGGGAVGLPPSPPSSSPAAPAPSVTSQQQYSSGGGSNTGSDSSVPPSPSQGPQPADPLLAGLPQERVLQIEDLVNQWEQLVGFSATVPEQLLANMAKNNSLTDIYDVSQYLKANMGSAWGNVAQQPWAWYGMSATEYTGRLAGFSNIWLELTGSQLPSNDGTNLVDQAFKQYQGQMTETQFQQWLMSNQTIQNTYGWLKYGLNFQQFQQQKLGMNLSFGRTLSDAEGVTQLQYLKSATGPQMAIANQPTFTQQERKQANVGISGSVAR